jgi:hypothetical protein
LAELLRKERIAQVWALEYSKEKLKEEIVKIKEEGKRKEDMTLTPHEGAIIRNYEDASPQDFPFTGTMKPPHARKLTCRVFDVLNEDFTMKLWALEYTLEKLNDEIAKIEEACRPKEDMTLTPYWRSVRRKEHAQAQRTSIPEQLPYGCYSLPTFPTSGVPDIHNSASEQAMHF